MNIKFQQSVHSHLSPKYSSSHATHILKYRYFLFYIIIITIFNIIPQIIKGIHQLYKTIIRDHIPLIGCLPQV